MFSVPRQSLPTGTALEKEPPLLFAPLKIRGAEFQNRIWVSPMCQYSTATGALTDFHFTHLTGLAFRGPSLTIIEATAVSPEGRISPYDCGLWEDSQTQSYARVADFVHGVGQKLGIQLAHAGRKASTKPMWGLSKGKRSEVATFDDGGWPSDVIGPTSTSWGEGHADPKSMTLDNIHRVTADFVAAAKRAVQAGIDVIEIHGAHGYLISSFLSPTSNTRTDSYGGSIENRMRFPLEIVEAVRRNIPDQMPLIFRISGTEWLSPRGDDNQWDVESTTRFAIELDRQGIDLLTISSGGNSIKQRMPPDSNYQTDIARDVRQRLRKTNCPLLIGAVGRIKEPKQAADLLEPEKGEKNIEAAGDVILIGRQFLKEANWVLRAAHELGVKVQWPVQYILGRHGLEAKL